MKREAAAVYCGVDRHLFGYAVRYGLGPKPIIGGQRAFHFTQEHLDEWKNSGAVDDLRERVKQVYDDKRLDKREVKSNQQLEDAAKRLVAAGKEQAAIAKRRAKLAAKKKKD